jgi:hypothetical protein
VGSLYISGYVGNQTSNPVLMAETSVTLTNFQNLGLLSSDFLHEFQIFEAEKTLSNSNMVSYFSFFFFAKTQYCVGLTF